MARATNKLKPVRKLKPGPKARTGRLASVRITVRFDDHEAKILRRQAVREGYGTLSRLIRERVL
jgi:hypothetical protein